MSNEAQIVIPTEGLGIELSLFSGEFVEIISIIDMTLGKILESFSLKSFLVLIFKYQNVKIFHKIKKPKSFDFFLLKN